MAIDSSGLRQFIGQGEIYVGAKKPADGTDQEFVAGVPETGIPVAPNGTDAATYIGLTSGPASLEYKPDFKGVEVEQAYGEIAPRVTKEMVSLKFKCALATYLHVMQAVQTGTLVTTPSGDGNAPDKNTIHVGGLTFFDAQTVVLVSKLGSYLGSEVTPLVHNRFEWVTLYEAMSVSGIKLDYKRGENRMVEVTFNGYADVARTENDQLFQIGQDTEPA